MHTLTSSELSIFFLAIGTMLILARMLSKIGRQLNISSLITEIVAGIILGPTLLGAIFPEIHGFFFPILGGLPSSYDALFNLSVVMLLFLVGMDLDFDLFTQQAKGIIITGSFAILLPLLGGFYLSWQFFDFFHGIDISAAPFVFSLIFATIMASTAPGVAARILMSHNILNTRTGIVILGVAMTAELLCWLLFSSIMVYVNAAESNMQIIYTLLYIIAFFIVVFFIASQKKIMEKIFSETPKHSSVKDSLTPVSYDLAMLLGICLLTASFTNAIHVHSALGALIAGIVCKKIIGSNTEILKVLELFVLNFFAPIFFISIGLQLDFAANFNLWMVLALFVIACGSKLVGGYLGASLSGLSKDKTAIAFGLNARGTVEIIMAALALKMQLIGLQLFVAIVIVSIVASFMAEFGLMKVMSSPSRKKNI